MKTPKFLAAWSEAAYDLAERLEASTLVVLGRDAWPVVAYLRSTGRRCQYFLCSRLQIRDESTSARWLAEVPPGALVLDTGYRGTIPEWLVRIDPTIVGAALMCADDNAVCSQLGIPSSRPVWLAEKEPEIDHGTLVDDIERSPKLTARCTGYAADGTAQFAVDDDGDHVDTSMDAPVQNYLLLREMGLEVRSASKYAGFTGATAAERIGCSRHEVREHLLQVRRARKHVGKVEDVLEFLRHVERLESFDADKFVRDNFEATDAIHERVGRLWDKCLVSMRRARRKGETAKLRRRQTRHNRIAAVYHAWERQAGWSVGD